MGGSLERSCCVVPHLCCRKSKQNCEAASTFLNALQPRKHPFPCPSISAPAQVFISDKTRAKALAAPGGEPPNRIKKQLLAEVGRGRGRGRV